MAGVLVAGIALLAVLYVLGSLVQPFAGGEGGERVRVVIPNGSGVGDIAGILEERGVVASSLFFQARATLGGRRGDLRPGLYTLEQDMSYGDALDALAAGPPRNLVNVTIPEGRSRPEVARLASRAGLTGSYERASVRSKGFDPRRYGARRARDLEGFLFPATYELRRGSSAKALVAKQLETFRKEIGQVDLRAARRRNLTAYDVLIIASMVEREAQAAKERPIIASVIYNRLREGMPLGIDATVRFATGNQTRPLTRSELAVASPYNTRVNAGLPPGPIGSPGIASLKAAARPARTDFLFYVVKPGTCPVEHDFSTGIDEFERDVARYNRERAAAGGRSPTGC